MHGDTENRTPRPPRRATLLNFDWILERISRQRAIKERLASDKYDVDSKNVACALLSKDNSKNSE